ncbi:methenyltetrahydrofolate synthase domain-containing isoform X2 [Labeo rohita]|uniref:Methenyltetrahydrofolate synthase domain-containing protein n=1 Tax=Labeo rohita TaxID=84645 RepID=A0A498N7W0_LABRO|nr:methenyltetrahydrofolate synthase domain-containing isoform X2 [Labeo rohita]
MPILRLWFDEELELKQDFRLSRRAIKALQGLLHREHDHGWGNQLETLIYVYWLAHGLSYRVVSSVFNVPKATVHRIIHKVAQNIWVKLKNVIFFPRAEELQAVGQGFVELSRTPAFKNVVGAIDGTHIRIKPLRQHQIDYLNYKGFYSISMQAICDSSGRFLDIFVGYPGYSATKKSTMGLVFFFLFLGEGVAMAVGDAALAPDVLGKGDTKWDIRHKVWNYIEAKNLASFPRPVHNRIPNFKVAAHACKRLPDLQKFRSSRVIKVNPDRPQEHARFIILEGIKEFSVPVGLDDKVYVDLVVVGSVAVSEKAVSLSQHGKWHTHNFGFGWGSSSTFNSAALVGSDDLRIGKGEGFADMEYAMMACMGAMCESTVVITIVHDCQVVDIPEELIESHDLTVDFILTPTRIIRTECLYPKPQGIIWSKLHTEILKKIPILKKLRTLEQAAGEDVTLKTMPAEEDETKISSKLKWQPNCHHKAELQCEDLSSEDNKCAGFDHKFPKSSVTTICLSNVPAGLRVSELKSLLREQEAVPLRISWQGTKHRAFLLYPDYTSAEHALTAFEKLSINGRTLHAECARSQRPKTQRGYQMGW